MFDFGMMEIAVIALLALLVVGPKEMPRMIHTLTRYLRKVRAIARDFQSGIDEVVREAELDEIRQTARQTAKKVGNFGLDVRDGDAGTTDATAPDIAGEAAAGEAAPDPSATVADVRASGTEPKV